MAYSRVTIYDPRGYLIGELDVPTKRSWVLNGVGRCTFTVPTFDPITGGNNPKCTFDMLTYGRFVLVEHQPTQNADGTHNGLLPPWVGIIIPQQSWGYGKVAITAESAEQVLFYRPMGNLYLDMPPGGLFRKILEFANSYGGIQIQPGIIDMSGVNTSLTLRVTALEEIQNLAKYSGFEWDITPVITANNQLILQGNWYKKKGVPSGRILNNANLQLTDGIYTEQGKVYNYAYASNEGTTPQTRVVAFSKDDTSNSQHGVFAGKTVVPSSQGSAQDVMQAAADTLLASSKNPTRTFAPTLLDVDQAFSFAAVGNTWMIENNYVGFQNGGIGLNGEIRITAVEYDDLTNTAKMVGLLQ